MWCVLLCLVNALTGSLALPVDDENHLYRRTYLFGPPTPVRLGSSECVEISTKLHGQVTSIDTRGKCVELWSKSGCQGVSSRIAPGAKHHLDLRLTIVKNNAKSLTKCNSNLRRGIVNVIAYQGKHYRGISQELNIGPGECVNLNANMRRSVSSVKTGKACILLWSRPDCTGDYAQIESFNPNQNDLSKLSFLSNPRLSINDNAESISLCNGELKSQKSKTQEISKATYLDYFDAVNAPFAALNRNITPSTYNIPSEKQAEFKTRYGSILREVEIIVPAKTLFTRFNSRHQEAVLKLAKVYESKLMIYSI